MIRSRGLGMVRHLTRHIPPITNFRPDEGAGPLESWKPPPLQIFFSDCQKTAGLCAEIFCTSYHASVPHMLWKFKIQVTQGQVTRSRQTTSPHKKFECSSTLHRLNDCLETFNDWYTVHKMLISEFLYRWPMVRLILWPLHISQWEKIEKRLFWTKTI